jgi:hypothetical protein
MSYPSFGCFAECLTCELCEGSWPSGSDDDFDPFALGNPYDGDADGDGVPDWADPDWGPEPFDESDPFDDVPTGIPFFGGEMRPTWDPYGVEFEWEF